MMEQEHKLKDLYRIVESKWKENKITAQRPYCRAIGFFQVMQSCGLESISQSNLEDIVSRHFSVCWLEHVKSWRKSDKPGRPKLTYTQGDGILSIFKEDVYLCSNKNDHVLFKEMLNAYNYMVKVASGDILPEHLEPGEAPVLAERILRGDV